MTEPYLPQWATAQEAGEWLEFKTGQRWPLVRLVEAGVNMATWLDCAPDAPPEIVEHLFQGRLEGFMAPVVFVSDLARLAAARDGVTLSETHRPDGVAVRMTPPPVVAADDLRFSQESVRAVAAAIDRGAQLRGESYTCVLEFENGSTVSTCDLQGLELHGMPAKLELLTDWQTPAAPETPPAPAGEPASEFAPDRGRRLKRSALIEENVRRWPTVDRDLKDAAENGLSAAATGDRGYWWEGDAHQWAKARGKLKESSAAGFAGPASVFQHRIKG
jgi:hypothetical protein